MYTVSQCVSPHVVYYYAIKHTEWFSATDDSGAFLIDRSPEYFEPLLNFLRHGKLILNQGINPQGGFKFLHTQYIACICVCVATYRECMLVHSYVGMM